MKTRLRSFLLIAVMAMLLSACRAVVDTDVKADGSGTFRTAIVFTAQEKQDFEKKPENTSKSICGDAEKNVPAGATFVEEIHNGETYCVTQHAFKNLTELRQFYAGMSQVQVNTLQLESGKFTLDVDVDLTSSQDQKGLVNEWHLTLPGKVSTQNADRVEGQTLVWIVSPGEKAHLQAQSIVESDGANANASGMGTLILIAIGIGVLALVGIVALIFVQQRNRVNIIRQGGSL